MLGATVKAGERVTIDLDPGRHAYLVPASGAIEAGGVPVAARDGAAITDIARLDIIALVNSEIIFHRSA